MKILLISIKGNESGGKCTYSFGVKRVAAILNTTKVNKSYFSKVNKA